MADRLSVLKSPVFKGSFSIETIYLLDTVNFPFLTGTICYSIRTFRSISEHNLDRSES